MQRFTRSIDRDSTRSTTPPTKTAGRFLSSPEKVAALRKVLDSAPAGEAGTKAVRDYLLADMAVSGVVDAKKGALRADTLRAWRQRWGESLDAAPGLAKEVDAMIARAQRGEQMSQRLAGEVKAAERNLREKLTAAGRDSAAVERQIEKSALGFVMDADPDKTIAAIMSDSTQAGRRLDELVKLTAKNENARNGLKAAVRDYLLERTQTTATEKLPAGDSRGPLSFAKVHQIFAEHQDSLAKVYSPKEMQALRVVHKALEVQGLERVRVRSGADTVEKLLQNSTEEFLRSPQGKALDAALRLKFGMLKGGGIIGTVRRYAAGMTNEDGARAYELLQRASFDPDLAVVLASRKLKANTPQFHNAIQRALAAGAGSRALIEDDETAAP